MSIELKLLYRKMETKVKSDKTSVATVTQILEIPLGSISRFKVLIGIDVYKKSMNSGVVLVQLVAQVWLFNSPVLTVQVS